MKTKTNLKIKTHIKSGTPAGSPGTGNDRPTERSQMFDML
jgi:hypothetical protein